MVTGLWNEIHTFCLTFMHYTFGLFQLHMMVMLRSVLYYVDSEQVASHKSFASGRVRGLWYHAVVYNIKRL